LRATNIVVTVVDTFSSDFTFERLIDCARIVYVDEVKSPEGVTLAKAQVWTNHYRDGVNQSPDRFYVTETPAQIMLDMAKVAGAWRA
jgi:hypothetical protein